MLQLVDDTSATSSHSRDMNQLDLAHAKTIPRQITSSILMQVSVRVGDVNSIAAPDPPNKVAICTWQCIIKTSMQYVRFKGLNMKSLLVSVFSAMEKYLTLHVAPLSCAFWVSINVRSLRG